MEKSGTKKSQWETTATQSKAFHLEAGASCLRGVVFLFLPVQQVKLLMKEFPNNHLGSIKNPALNHGLFFSYQLVSERRISEASTVLLMKRDRLKPG